MNLTYLRSFYETIKCNSISKAAIELHLTQPGLSRQLKSLERDLDNDLLIRSNKGIELTEAGKILYESAESMLSLEDNIMKNLEKLKDNNNSISFYCCNSIGENIVPCSIYTFKQIYTNINIEMSLDNHTNILTKLLTHDINLAIIQNVQLSDSLETTNILADNLVLVSGDLTAPNSIKFEDLINYELILINNDSGIHKILTEALSTRYITVENLNVLFYSNSIESIKSTLKGNKAFSILPESSLRHELRKGTLKKIHIENFDIHLDYCIAHRANYNLSTNEKQLIKFLTSKKRCFCY